MLSRIRTAAVVAGAAALMTAQVAYAAPARSIDPLVALSAFGTAQSRSAVCAAGATAAAAGAAATAQAPGANCVLPVTAEPVPVVDTTPTATYVEPVPSTGFGVGALPLLLGLAALVGAAVLLMGGDDDEGDLTPVTPV